MPWSKEPVMTGKDTAVALTADAVENGLGLRRNQTQGGGSLPMTLTPDGESQGRGEGLGDEKVGAVLERDKHASLSATAVKVLAFLAIQNCAKNIVMRAAVRGRNVHFLYSAAVVATELLKCVASFLWVVLVDRGSIGSIARYLRIEWRKTVLLMVPAGIYNFQKTLEYVALRNLNAAVFSVLVQTKLFTTALCAVLIMGKSLRRAQVLSLVLLVVGCVLAQLTPPTCPEFGDSNAAAEKNDDARGTASSSSSSSSAEDDAVGNKAVGIIATLLIAFSSGFASVYTEKVIKAADRSAAGARAGSAGRGAGAAHDNGGPLPGSGGALTGLTGQSSSQRAASPGSGKTTTTLSSRGTSSSSSSAMQSSTQSAAPFLLGATPNGISTASSLVASADGASDDGAPKKEGLAYTQIQLALASLVIQGAWTAATDYPTILDKGLWTGFGPEACLAVSMTALGGLAVAAVLRYADAILKGYATAISVVLTGVASHALFGTTLGVEYALGMIVVTVSIVLYNSRDLDKQAF